MDEEKTQEVNTTEETLEVEMPEVKKEVPKLTPEQEADVARLRQVFRQMHDEFADSDVVTAEMQVATLMGTIGSEFEAMKQKVTIKDLAIKSEDEKMKSVLEKMADLTVEEAFHLSDGLVNAITHHTKKRTMEWKVKDMEIVLL